MHTHVCMHTHKHTQVKHGPQATSGRRCRKPLACKETVCHDLQHEPAGHHHHLLHLVAIQRSYTLLLQDARTTPKFTHCTASNADPSQMIIAETKNGN